MDIEKSFRANMAISNGCSRAIKEMEQMFVDLAYDLNDMPDSREKSLCLTKLQESKFWAIECLTKVIG